MLGFGTLIYVALLLTNAMAVLSEDRFLARIGWSSTQPNVNVGYHQLYEQTGYGTTPGEISVKARMINLISAVRTLMRIPLIVLNVLVIVRELIFG